MLKTMGSNIWSPAVLWRRFLFDMDRVIRRGFHVDPFSFTVLIAFGASLLLFAICMPLICCCARRKKNQRNAKEKTSEPLKRRYPLSVAKFDEFETLSPLIVSPNSSNAPSFRQKRIEADRIRASRELFLRQHNIRVDESPPPPRRFNGRTVIVPLASNSTRPCRPLIAPLLGSAQTPDSRVTTFEMTTKSCATIPEDDEFELDDEEPHRIVRHLDDDEITAEGDLISIDRTYISTKESRCVAPRFRHMMGNYADSPVPVPEFQIQPPKYSPPAPPKTDTVHSTPVKQRHIPSRHDTNTQGQSNLSSPEMSSCGFDSMVEAESDFIIALDVDDNEKMVIEFEGSSVESVQQQLKNLQLHRIEEESEQFDEASSISRFLYSSSGSSLNKFNNANMRMPRSISQQLEFMINNNAH